MIPKVITHIKYKPLVPPDAKVDHDKILRSLQRQILKSVRQNIFQETFSQKAKRALAQSVQAKVGANSITLTAKHPAFFPLIKGQKSQQMTWLAKAKAPIPIILDDGTLIFRSATAKSLKNGKWIHPGHEPTTVIERARKEARAVVKERIVAEVRKQLRGR